MRTDKILQKCREIAYPDHDNIYKKSYHGCVVSVGSRIIGSGRNDNRRSFLRGKEFHSVHAEMMAIMMSGLIPISTKGKYSSRRGFSRFGRPKYDLWVIRIGSNQQLMNSHPCDECVKMMREYGIYRIFYSNSEGEIESIKVAEVELIRPMHNWSLI